MSSPAPKVVGYFTDVEGNWEYFQSCLALSSVLQWSDATQTELILKDDCYFVFGGDAGDKRDGTMRFVNLMIKLKRRYPDRVFLLVGNRDANKLRFLSELTERDLRACIPPLPPGVTGASKDCRQYLKELAVQQGMAESADGASEDAVQALNTMANRLRWILDCTMGSVGDFEYRRSELALLSHRATSDISDEEVVSSFYNSVADADGFMRQYLQLGQLAVVIDSTLYVHGGVYGVFDKAKGIQSCVGIVPNGDDLANQLSVEDRDEWVLQLNQWLRAQVASIIADPAYSADRTSRSGQALFLYGSYATTPSVIMARMLDDASMPLPVPQETADHLKRWRLSRVVCGHTPHGNCPTVFTSNGIQVVMADTSFSDMSSKSRSTDNRGCAASEVLVCGPALQVHGILQDNVPVNFISVIDRQLLPPSTPIFTRDFGSMMPPSCTLAVSPLSATPLQDIASDDCIGRLTKDGYFVKSKTADGRLNYLLCKVSGRDYSYKYVCDEDLPLLL